MLAQSDPIKRQTLYIEIQILYIIGRVKIPNIFESFRSYKFDLFAKLSKVVLHLTNLLACKYSKD